MYESEYKSKLRTPEEAVKVVKSGDLVDYGYFNGQPKALDQALAKRKDELWGVNFNAAISLPPLPEVPQSDPTGKHFRWNGWHHSAFDAQLGDKGLCSYTPLLYHEVPYYYRKGELQVDVAMLRVTPMDKYGYFNFGISTSHLADLCENARIVILEENESVPYVYGYNGQHIHISDVDYVVHGENELMCPLPPVEATEAEKKIADFILEKVHDGSCIQLGIGGLPNYLGKQIANAGMRDLGAHTEMLSDAYLEMCKAGCMSGKKKEIDRGVMVCAFALGGQELYDFMERNPRVMMAAVDYTNHPSVISQISNMVSINASLEIDLYGQVVSEMQGTRQLTGTGGQWDFVYGSYHSPGGKSFICMPSTYKDKQGNIHSKIKPFLTPGAASTVSRQLTNYVVTDCGITNLKAKSTWVRAESLIEIAHPDFRDELIKEADKIGLWKPSNKLEP